MARLLVVDDDRTNCQILSKLLGRRGYEVQIANSGREALELLERQDFDLALLDYQMPGMNGVELYKHMKEMRPDLGGIFLTAFARINTIYAAIGAGADRVLAMLTAFRNGGAGRPNLAALVG